MRYGVTGPRELEWASSLFICGILGGVLGSAVGRGGAHPDEVVSGAAFGVDTEAAQHADFLGARVRLTVPAAPHNVALVDRGRDLGWAIEYGPEAPTPSEAYMKRNDLTVARIEVLLAFPPSTVEVTRGGPAAGTWSTIRRARKAGLEVRVFPLNGAAPWVEAATSTRLAV